MPEIALIGDRTFLFERLFQGLQVDYQFLQPSLLGSPFLPKFRMVIIPAGFANPQYSRTLPALERYKANIARFVKEGGVLTIFGPLVSEHSYEWLPLPLKYVCEYGVREIAPLEQECPCICETSTPECDGYLIPGEGFRTVLQDSTGRAVIVAGRLGEGMIVATSVHEFPAAEFIRWALSKAKPARI